uniref:Uncharacterized protein n=1 Tax=Magallana gigas TaxID=29159 RepID=A0A8W8NJ47_MAGGI
MAFSGLPARGSLCLKVGTPKDGISPGDWEECFVTLPGDLTVQQMEQLCYLACKKKNESDAVCYATNQNLDSSNALYALLQDVNQRKQSSGGIKLAAVLCRAHTQTPNAKPALKLTDTLRRRRRQPEQQYRAQGPSGPPPPYSAHGGPPQGHRKGAGAKGGRYNNLEMRKV